MSVTMSDIAVRAGTSIAAVSVTLNGARSKTLKVSAQTRERILSAANELGYRRNPFARALATGRSNILGVMLPFRASLSEHDAFFSLVTSGINTCAAERGYNVMMYTAAAQADAELAATMIDRLVAGVVMVSSAPDSPLYDVCRRQEIPYAVALSGPEVGPLTINADDYAGGRFAVEHLISLGHRRIAHLRGQTGYATTDARVKAYEDALDAHGLERNPHWCVPAEFSRDRGYEFTRILMQLPADQRPTALFAANDLSAHGAIDAVHSLGLRVPEDLAIVGFDDTWYATITRPQLTSVHVDVPGIGYRAAAMLFDQIAADAPMTEHVMMPVSLSIRESCGGLPPASPPRLV